MGALEIVLLTAVAAWFVFAVIYLIRHKGGCSCGGGKKGCPHACGSCCGDCEKCRRERKDDGNN